MEQLKSFEDSSKYKVGQLVKIEDSEYKITQIKNSSELYAQFGINSSKSIPVLYLDGQGGSRRGAYHPDLDIILFFTNTDLQTQKHELVHSIEVNKEKSIGLQNLFELVKSKITEDSFAGGFFSFNFNKNISEFVADGYSKESFINALKKENLYEEFLKETAYLFNS